MSTVNALKDQVAFTSPSKAIAPIATPTAITAATGEPERFTEANRPGISRRRPIASSMRESPRSRLSRTPNMAVIGPMDMIHVAPGFSKVLAATSKGATSDCAAPARPLGPIVEIPTALKNDADRRQIPEFSDQSSCVRTIAQPNQQYVRADVCRRSARLARKEFSGGGPTSRLIHSLPFIHRAYPHCYRWQDPWSGCHC